METHSIVILFPVHPNWVDQELILILDIQTFGQRYTYRVLQTIQLRLKLLYVWAEPAVLGSAKTALKFKYEI